MAYILLELTSMKWWFQLSLTIWLVFVLVADGQFRNDTSECK